VNATDLSWNGSNWVADADGGTDFNGQRNFFNDAVKLHTHEFAIPLNSVKADNSGNSDLDIDPNNEVGLLIRVAKMASGGGSFCWNKTSGDSSNASGYDRR
jgi:hypothetical protein